MYQPAGTAAAPRVCPRGNVSMPVMNSPADLARRIENILRFGTIVSVDHAAALCVVRTGALQSRPMKWMTLRAGDARTWWAPSVGEQVLVLCPGGTTERGVVLPAIYADAAQRPAGGDHANVTLYTDGAIVSYDPVAHELVATLPDGGKAKVTAPGGVEIHGDVAITGKLTVSDDTNLAAKLHVASDVTVDTKVTASDDVIGGDISLKNHKHGGVQSGGGVSGAPQ